MSNNQYGVTQVHQEDSSINVEKRDFVLSTRGILITIIMVAIILRSFSALYQGNVVTNLPGIFDQISYHNLALRVLGGHGFSFGELWWPITPANAPTAHWSFFYTLYLTTVYKIFGPYPLVARVIQAIIVGVLHPFIAYCIGKKLFGKNTGYVTAGITALYIYYIYYGAALMTEPFYITSILFSLFISMQLAESTRRDQDIRLGIALGISIGVTLLLRQVFLLFIPFLFLWIWTVRFIRSRNLPFVSTALSIALIVLFILPVTLYNYSRFGRFVLLNTNSGYAFFWGNHPIYGTKFIPILPSGTYQRLIPLEVRHLDEAALDQELLQRGLRFVLDDPKRYTLLSLSRIPTYFMFWPSADSEALSNISRVASFGITWPFMLWGLILSVKKVVSKKGREFLNLILSPEGLLMIFVVIYSVVHLLTWALIRYRLPVDAVLIPFAALAVVDIMRRIAVMYPAKERSRPV
jgi:4-amino-4-deoxy-L-arabinose transferase-like glycosyltransferase